MPKYRNAGTSEVQHGSLKVLPGDTLEAFSSPGKQFVLVEEEAPPVFVVNVPVSKKKEPPTTTSTAQTQGE